ncbi:hypothetical protein [Anaerocolumna jejuensis]|uniref:hypothetical protein n=1 Tax=Anaerocolumna jejuensis TaxID=259063 RepID=UPI003F7C1C2D
MNTQRSEDKVRNFADYMAKGRMQKNNCCDDNTTISKGQLLSIFEDILDNKAFDKEYLENNNHINELENAKKVLELKLKNSLPKHILIYMIVNSLIIGAVISAAVIQILGNVKIIDYYILLLLGVMSTGLLGTTLKLLSEWKEYLGNNGEKRR